jgi:molecular chaperone DnaK
MSKILGIDLGSTNSAFSIFEGNEAKLITNIDGQRTTQSIVAFTKNGDELVGSAAARQMVTNSKNTVTLVKRLIGRKFEEVKDFIKDFSYEVVAAANGDCRIKINDKEYSPEEISAKILAKIKKDAETYLGEKIDAAVVTVPAYFSDSQRQSVKDACTIAGMECKRIINEPTAAALAYSADKGINKKIAVYDLGGSTFDISILDVADGVVEVLATNGNTTLGGHDIDVKLMHYVTDEFKKEQGIDLLKDQMAMQRVKDECEKAKCALSTSKTYDINLPFITADATGPKHLMITISQAKLEEIADEVIQKTVEPCKLCIADAGNVKIDEVLLVGGQTRMPKVQEIVKNIFGIEPNRNINPDEAVSLGAGVQAGVLGGQKTDVLLLDVTPLTLSICTNGQVATPMIDRNTTIPVKKTQTFSNAAPMQPAATILIGQGERKMFADNKLLGQFNVELTPQPQPGMNQIEISYEIDANGILTVEAFDKALNKKANITITSSSGLSKEEIEKAKADAEAHAAEDEKKLELVNEKNHAESLCNAIERAFKDVPADKITEDEKKPVVDAIAKVREVIKTDDIEKIKSEVEAMNKLYEPLASKLYQSAGGTVGPDGKPQFTQEQMDAFMKDPKFQEMFGGMNGNPFTGTTTNNTTNTKTSNDAEFVYIEQN